MIPEFPQGKVIRVVSSTLYHIKDSQTSSTIKIKLSKQPTKPNFYPLLKTLQSSKLTYELISKNKKSIKNVEGYQQGNIYLDGKNISSLYCENQEIKQCIQQKIFEKDQMIECYIMKVQCLKLKLFILSQNKFITFYFTDFKLPKLANIHPKEVWQKCQQYFNQEILGDFVQIIISGSETYRDQLNIHGDILRLHNGLDIKQKIINDGYAQLSKNCENYISVYKIDQYKKMIKKSKKEANGMWKNQIVITKSNNHIIQASKYDKWQQWSKNKKKFTDLKNAQQQIKQLCAEFKKNSNAKADPSQNKTLLQAFMTVMDQSVTDKNICLVEDMVKVCISALSNLQFSLSLQVQNIQFLKYLNKIMIILIFYVTESQKQGTKNGVNKNMVSQLEKGIKIIFKCCFLGNQTFHKKVFNKHLQSDFQRFSYDPAYLSGISSYSQYSDYQQSQKTTKQNKLHKKITASQTKIRINSTLLLSLIFKNYAAIVQNHWEICVKSNVLTQDFFAYLQKLKITIDLTKMTPEQKKNIAALMRTNFGDYSLILLIFFQHNSKVKINALNCIINMISNFQGKKMIDTTEAVYIEKLLKQTKSSFVPKSFIIFSGLRNILYFMLFSLHHEKNIVLIVNTFRALTELCQQSTLIDKMGFMEGMGLLMSNYINPVLKFSWDIPELTELKILCVEFLGALVNSQKKWQQMENQYLLKQGQNNINYCLLQVIKDKKKNQIENINEDKIVVQITKYFMKMARRYYTALFFSITPQKSIWSQITNFYMQNMNHNFSNFVQQVFKCHFDNIALIKSQKINSRRIMETIEVAEKQFSKFLELFLPKYSQIVTNQNYISLINILTYISYQKWSQNSFKVPRQFLLHCFKNVGDKKSQQKNQTYPSIQAIKNNSLVRIALIKLLGYMSFCNQFQKKQISISAIRNLLKYSRNYKSLNSVVKITWGISNWSNIPCFKQDLKQQQLKQCLDYMIHHSHSDKQKIASNCTRGIGFFINNLKGAFDVEKCREAVMKNLSHQIIKVRTNSTKTFRAMVSAGLIWSVKDQPQKTQQLVNILEQNILKNNYHLQTETLLLIKQLGNPIKKSQMLKIYSHILRDLSNHTTMQYQFSQIKALKQLRRNVLEQIAKIPEELKENENAAKQFYQAIQNFMMDSRQQSSRKEAENSKIFDRGFEKGQAALNAVFNIKNEKYDQQKMITTQFTLKGLQYEANQEDLQLLGKIKQAGQLLQKYGNEWEELSNMSISGKKISLGKTNN